jgi:hypothetical protein
VPRRILFSYFSVSDIRDTRYYNAERRQRLRHGGQFCRPQRSMAKRAQTETKLWARAGRLLPGARVMGFVHRRGKNPAAEESTSSIHQPRKTFIPSSRKEAKDWRVTVRISGDCLYYGGRFPEHSSTKRQQKLGEHMFPRL